MTLFAREAIMQAAAHIEQHPELYDFFKHDIPEDGKQGCLLGWIGRFAGLPAKKYSAYAPPPILLAARKIGYLDEADFYAAMHRYGFAGASVSGAPVLDGWAYNPKSAARTLRCVALHEHS